MVNLTNQIEVILFDLGGVLVELTGVPTPTSCAKFWLEIHCLRISTCFPY